MQLEQANLILKDFAQSRARATSHSQSGGKWRSVAAALLTLLREKHTYCHRRMKTKWYNQVTRDDVKHPFPLSWKQCKSYILAAQSLEILSTVEVAHDQIGRQVASCASTFDERAAGTDFVSIRETSVLLPSVPHVFLHSHYSYLMQIASSSSS